MSHHLSPFFLELPRLPRDFLTTLFEPQYACLYMTYEETYSLKSTVYELLAKNHITIYGNMMCISLKMVISGYFALETLAFDMNISSVVLAPLLSLIHI